MAGDPQSCRYRAGVKRSSDDGYRDENHLKYDYYQEEIYERGFDYHAPVSVTVIANDTNTPKRPRSSSSSSALHCSKHLTKSRSRIRYSGSRGACLRMEELQCIKRELKVIKDQIDELLNSLEHMDTCNSDTSEASLPHSPLSSSVSSMEGFSCSPLRSNGAFRKRQSLKPRGTRYEKKQMKNESDVCYV